MDSGTPVSVTNGAAFRIDPTGQVKLRGDYNADNTGDDNPNAPLTNIQTVGFSGQQFLTGFFPTSLFPAPPALRRWMSR